MDRKPRILQICHDFKGPFRTIARQYAGCFADCDVKTIFLRGAESSRITDATPGEVEFMMLEPGALRGLKLGVARRLEEIIGDQVPDIVIAHRYKPFFISLLLNRKMNFPLILGVMHEYGFLRRWTRAFLSRFWPDNVHLIGVSSPVCDEIRSKVPGLRDRIHLVPNAIEGGTLLDSVSARHQLGLPLGTYCYGVIGRLVHKKNHALLLRAFAKLGDDSVLAIVGNGELRSELRELAASLKIEKRVVFSGYQDNARDLMKAFDSFVFPSGEEEAFGLVLLEAMAASTPVLCSDAKGPLSVVGDTARTFSSGDVKDLAVKMAEMQKLSREEENEMTELALRRLGEEFSIAAMVQNLRGLRVVEAQAPITM